MSLPAESTHPLLRAAALACLLLSFGACQPYGAQYREYPIHGRSGNEIWRAITEFAETRMYRTDPAATDVGLKTYQSRWNGGAGAFRRSRRERFHARIVPTDDEKAEWVVRYYVERQRVGDTDRNMRPEEDDWEFAGQNVHREREFRTVLGLRFPVRGAKADENAIDGTAGAGTGPRR